METSKFESTLQSQNVATKVVRPSKSVKPKKKSKKFDQENRSPALNKTTKFKMSQNSNAVLLGNQ